MILTYKDPVSAVFLRLLAWERFIAGEKPRVKDAVELLQMARNELGLLPLTEGAAQLAIQRLRPPGYLSAAGTPPVPLEKEWQKEWRLLHLPSHHLVRELSDKPVVNMIEPEKGLQYYEISLRNTALPQVHVFIGTGHPKTDQFDGKRGVYFLNRNNKLYLGQSTEFKVRRQQHDSKNEVEWWCFVTPNEKKETLSRDTLDAAESLLICFWSEICMIENARRGSDQKPSTRFLQEAILIVEAASASLLYLLREKFPEFILPYKKASIPGWPSCYTVPPRLSQVVPND